MTKSIYHGGKRSGSGRKPDPSTVKRIPDALLPTVNMLIGWHRQSEHLPPDVMRMSSPRLSLTIPLAQERVRAGFPSPAESYVDSALDFNDYLVSNPNATFAVYSSGDSMIDVGIYPGDLLVFDRSITPNNGDIIVASVGGEFTVKRLVITALGIELHPENSTGQYSVIRPTDGVEISLVGVLTHTIKRFKKA